MTKINSAVLLLIIACISSGALANSMLMDTIPAAEPTPQQTVTYWFACARGSLQGYEQGMYKKSNYVVNEQCLGQGAVNTTVKIYNLYFNNNADKDILSIFKLIQQLSHTQRQYCEFDDVINDMFKWCDNNDCTIDYMLQNILKKVIQITTVASNISNILNDASVQPSITDAQFYFQRWSGVASEAGKFMRYLTDFDATKLPTY